MPNNNGGIELAKAYVQIIPTTKGIQGELNSALTDAGEEAGKKGGVGIGNGLKTGLKNIGKFALAGIGAATAGVAALTKNAVDNYASYEQLTGGVEKLYGTAADQVMAFAQEAYKSAGLSANAYMETATGFSAALIGSLEGDVDEAARITDVAMRAMSDNVNVFGSDFESVQFAFQGFAKQNYTMLDNLKLGYGGTKTEMERLIADANKYRKSIGQSSDLSIDSFADVVLAIQSVQEAQGIAGTTGREAMTTIEGSATATRAAWSNLLTTIATGENVGPALDGLLNSLFGGHDGGGLINNLLPRIQTVLTGIGSFLVTAAPMFAEKINEIVTTLAPDLLQAGAMLLNELIPGVISMLPVLINTIIPMLPDLITTLLNAIISNLPMVLQAIGQMVRALMAAMPQILASLWNTIVGVWNQWMAPFLKNIGAVFSKAWEGLKAGAKAAWEGIKGVFGGIANWFGDVFRRAWQAVKNVFSAGGRIFEGIKEGIANVFKTVVNAIIRGINWVIAIPFNAINGFLNTLRGIKILGIKPFSWISTFSVPQIPELAQGGVLPKGQVGLLEGDGAEAVVPLERNTGWIRRVAEEMEDYRSETNNLQNVTINVYPSEGMDERQLAQRIGEILGSETGRDQAVFA